MQQPNYRPYRQPQPAPQPPPPPPKRMRFRWGLLVGLLVLMAFACFVNSLDTQVRWDDLLDRWGIVHKERFTKLAVLGISLCCACAIARVLRDSKDEDSP